MVGTIRINIAVGIIGFVLTFLFSVADNVFLTTILRSLYCFVILFAASFVFRWMLGALLGLNGDNVVSHAGETPDDHRGTVVNAVTPDEQESLNELLKQPLHQEEASFAPLQPKKLSTKLPDDPHEMANAVRRMTEQ